MAALTLALALSVTVAKANAQLTLSASLSHRRAKTHLRFIMKRLRGNSRNPPWPHCPIRRRAQCQLLFAEGGPNGPRNLFPRPRIYRRHKYPLAVRAIVLDGTEVIDAGGAFQQGLTLPQQVLLRSHSSA